MGSHTFDHLSESMHSHTSHVQPILCGCEDVEVETLSNCNKALTFSSFPHSNFEMSVYSRSDDSYSSSSDNASLPLLPRPYWMRFRQPRVGPPITATKYSRYYPAPRYQSPYNIFKPMITRRIPPARRFAHVNSDNEASVLISTDGAALNNGQPNVRAGYGVVYAPDGSGRLSYHLGEENYPPTSNRAELLGAITALKVRNWAREGFSRVVIASDSAYLVNGICAWVFTWMNRDWTTARGECVKNIDLWEDLMAAVERLEARGIEVLFWLVSREMNEIADACAKQGAVRILFSGFSYCLSLLTGHGIGCVYESPLAIVSVIYQPSTPFGR